MPPRSTDARHATDADRAACTALLRSGSRSFHAASLLLPPATREAATAMYAFCRIADDAVDVDGGRMLALTQLRERLALIYAGRPAACAADRAFADVVERFGLPEALPAALLEGFEWDVIGRRYDDFGELCSYASRVAGTVGAMMCLLMGVRSNHALARACDLGVAMQLTNIARDVGEDARAGRLYLPLDWLAAAGIDVDAWMARPEFRPELAPVVARLLAEAEFLYARSAEGIADLPLTAQPSMQAARILYADIGRVVADNDFDSVSQRAVVPGSRKVWLVGAALLATLRRVRAEQAPALPATRFLVEAAMAAEVAAASAIVRQTLDDRVAWLVDLFERLEQREQGQRPLPATRRSA